MSRKASTLRRRVFGLALGAGVVATTVVPAAPSALATTKPISIAFFGFASNNSFTQAGWSGVEKAAKQYGATAHFFNGNFDGATQDDQVESATTEHKYNVFVIEAYDSVSMAAYAKRAAQEGNAVVAEYAPIGPSFSTVAAQVPGILSVVDVPTHNGKILGQMGVAACKSLNPCQVAFLVGNPTSPLDVARTNEAYAVLNADKKIQLVAKPVAGYTQSNGSTVTEQLLAAHPNVNVIIGSSQAIEGAQKVVQAKGLLKKIALIGNGGSFQAVSAVEAGQWYGTYYIDEPLNSYTATKYAIEKYMGQKVPTAVNSATLGPVGQAQGALTSANDKGVKGSYTDY